MISDGFHEMTDEELPRIEDKSQPSKPKAKKEINGGGSGALIQSSGEFVANFEPPDYLIDGLIQKRFLYSATGQTGAGKTSIFLRIAAHVALGLPLAGREIEPGTVLFFAGENPDDVRMRWIKLCEEMGTEPEQMRVYFLPGNPKLSDTEIRKRIDEETQRHGPFALIIIDTSAAYFEGEDENANVAMGNHARMLRSFVNISGGPTVIVTCHPKKNADPDDLLPRGGGAFLAEVDGNLICKQEGTASVELHWHGKFRGVDFAPIAFKLQPGTTERLKDKKGRLVWTVTARPIANEEQTRLDDAARSREDNLLLLMKDKPNLSLTEMAKELGWFYQNGDPGKSHVYNALQKLKDQKLAAKERGHWKLTPKGTKAAEETPTALADKLI